MQLSELLGEWITAGQRSGRLDPGLPAEVILYTMFARACDPVLGVLKASSNFSDERIVEMLLSTCFDGLQGRRPEIRSGSAPKHPTRKTPIPIGDRKVAGAA